MTDSEAPKHTNLLLGETSPYLLQHAHNPVDWHPWGTEAIDRAKAEDKPIFLSIGYSACHWCHVMERESFENEEIARALNESFISIKVDREERPDVDDLYMQAVQMMTGRGGWPMSLFLTPQLEPFFGGTYFPPEDGARGPGFRSLLLRLAEAYRRDREKIAQSAKQILRDMTGSAGAAAAERGGPGLTMLEGATADLRRRFDSVYGGFSGAPKFPPSMSLALLLAEHRRTGNPDLLPMVETTLDKMARGGLYDQLGGGFHRYSTDHRWLAPHFEKMLYDNALLAPVYFDASLVTGNKFYERIGRGVLDYVLREMTDEAGGYYSAEDADSEGVEGKFYLWDKSEVLEALGDEEGGLLCDFYDVSDAGNFEGRNILNVITPLEEFATRRGETAHAIETRLKAAREILLARRRARVPPGKDDKILTAWNGMMISAMARGAQVTGEERYRASAERAADFILENLRDERGGLLRTYRGGRAKIAGFLDDYAFFATGLLDLYRTTLEPHWLETAAGLAEKAFELFYDREGGGFFIGDGRDPTVVIRRKDTYDGATPSGNSAATLLALRLSILLDRSDYREIAMKSLESMSAHLNRMPGAVHHLLAAVQRVLAPPKEIAVIGDPAAPETLALLRALWTRYLPGSEIAAAAPGEVARGFNAKIALLKDKPALGEKPTAYVCENYTCKKPVTDVEELMEQLR